MSADVMNNENVRMIERTRRTSFLLEAPQSICISRERRRQNLDRYVAPQSRITRAIDFTHPARAERGDDFVWTKSCTWRKRHRSNFSFQQSLLISRLKSNLATLSARRRHELANSVKDYSELGIVLLFHRLKLACQILMRGQDLPQPNKGSHDFDIDADGPLAAQHTGKHRYALLGKGIRRRTAQASPT